MVHRAMSKGGQAVTSDEEREALVEGLARILKPQNFYSFERYTLWANRTVHPDEWHTLPQRAVEYANRVLSWLQEQGYRLVPESCARPNHGKRLHECELPPIDDQAGQPTGYRAILIQKARAEADHYRRFDDTEDLVDVLVGMANMLATPQGEPSDAEVK